MVSAAQQRAGGMGLEIPRAVEDPGIVAQHFGHRDLAAEQVPGTIDHAHRGEVRRALFRHGRAVGVDDDLLDLRAFEEGQKDVVKERPPPERTVVLARHAFARMAHGDEGDDVHGRFPSLPEGGRARQSNPRG